MPDYTEEVNPRITNTINISANGEEMPDHTKEVNPRITKTINISANVREPDINLDEYAKLNDPNQTIVAKEFIGDGSKLTNLPVGDIDLSGYASKLGHPKPNDGDQEGETVWTGKLVAIHNQYKNDLSQWDKLGDQAAIIAENSTNGLPTGYEPNYGNKVLLATNYYGIYQDTGGIPVQNRLQNLILKTSLGPASSVYLNVEGPVTATEFIGDGSKLTNLPSSSKTLQELFDDQGSTPLASEPFLKFTEDTYIQFGEYNRDSKYAAIGQEGYNFGNNTGIDERDLGKVFIRAGVSTFSSFDYTKYVEIYGRDGEISASGKIKAKEFEGDGSKLTGVGGDSTVKFIDCQEPAPPESEWKVGDIYIYKSTEPYELWSETCQGKCHAEWVECMESTGEEHACYNKYVPCLMGCDEDLTREQAEAIAKKGKQQPKGVVDMAHESWTGIAGELLDDGEYIICTDLYCGNKVDLYWQRMPKGASWSDVDKCAKKTDYTQTIIAKEFVGDGSKLTGVGLPDLRTLTPLT